MGASDRVGESFMIRRLSLNEQQLAFVRHREGPAALLAVPGSGKTTTMVCRTAALIQSGVPAERILTMTFTKAAALDMTRRYAELYGKEACESRCTEMTGETRTPDESDHADKPGQSVQFSTIHSFALQLIRYYCLKRRRPMPVILAESGPRGVDASGKPTRMGLLAQIHREIMGGRIGEDALESLSMGISLAKNTMADPKRAADASERSIKGFRQIFEAYEQVKKERRLMDFDDMLTVCFRILSMDAGILADMRSRYDFIQVDEAQDSSLIQHEMIDLLAKPRNNLVLIGDEDQSIYVWRGAHPSGLLGFRDRYPEAVLFLMETNYRSRASIVALADRFILGNKERTSKHLRIPAESLDEKGGGFGIPPEIELLRVKDIREQYGKIREVLQPEATEKQSRVKKPAETEGAPGEPSRRSDRSAGRIRTTAILYRNNRSAYGLADMLSRAGIPFHLRDFKDTLFNHWVTRDLKAFLTFIGNPADRESFQVIIGKLNAYLTRDVMDRMQAMQGEGSVWKQIGKSGMLTNFQRVRLEEVEERFRRLARMKPHDAILGLLDCVAYEKTLEFAARTQGYAPEFLNGLLDTLLTISAGESTIPGFLERLDTLRTILEQAKNPKLRHGGLILSTVHSAKGLEFDRVMMVDMVEGEFPSADTEATGSAQEEERRLCYVAITRARSELKIYVPKRWARAGAEPSRFVRELETALRELFSSRPVHPEKQ